MARCCSDARDVHNLREHEDCTEVVLAHRVFHVFHVSGSNESQLTLEFRRKAQSVSVLRMSTVRVDHIMTNNIPDHIIGNLL